ncbi:hypothetical protein [Methylophilus sp.]|uniref:hypothetical protein n=1 Tax=Methylophilus sp. TaxID=29541 RepID=UPI00257A8ED8|nr:hypothetical protein [Methylophilus sp.]
MIAITPRPKQYNIPMIKLTAFLLINKQTIQESHPIAQFNQSSPLQSERPRFSKRQASEVNQWQKQATLHGLIEI